MENPNTGLNLRLEYSSTLYGEDDMARFFDGFIEFFGSAIRDHKQPVKEIELCGPREIAHLRESFWNTKTTENYWNEKSVVDQILQAASIAPKSIAIETSDGEQSTYEQLLARSASIAASLQAVGAAPGDKIGIFSPPGVEAITSMLAALRCRCGYVAMDPEFAIDRLAFMAEDSGAKVLLFKSGMDKDAKEIKNKSGSKIALMGINDALRNSTSGLIEQPANGQDPFYMVYTSVSRWSFWFHTSSAWLTDS
jgi:non-ribosomal peptide synthetase component F